MAKHVGKALANGASCEPFRQHLASVRRVKGTPTAWSAVEAGFIHAMELFDASVIGGLATEGERQNGKGDYFNDLVAILLENCSGVILNRRSGVPGLIFPNHNLDVTYPPSGDIVEVLVEAKMMGTPRHPGSPKSKPAGRLGSADMLKRCKEGGFKSIDLKAGYGYKLSQAGIGQQDAISGDLTTWLRTVKPRSYMVFGVRVTSRSDLDAVVSMAQAMTQVVDGVGVFAYSPRGFRDQSLDPPKYERAKVPTLIDLGVLLHRICQDLRSAATAGTAVESQAARDVATPAEQITAAGAEAGVEDLETG